MKTLLTVIAFCLASTALGQIDYQTITPAALNEEINRQASARWTSVVEKKMISEVINSQRQDLLVSCFLNGHTYQNTLKLVAETPKGTNRLRATITLLRANSVYWPDDNNPGGGFSFITVTPGHLLVEPFISTVAELLPQEKLELHHMLSTKERIKLADRLEAALEKKTPTTSTPPAVAPIPSSGPEVKQAPNVPQITPKAPVPQPVETTSEPEKENESSSGLYLWLPIAVIAGLGLWNVTRKR